MDEDETISVRSLAEFVPLVEMLELRQGRKRCETDARIRGANLVCQQILETRQDSNPLAIAVLGLAEVANHAAEENHEAVMHTLQAVKMLAVILLRHVDEAPPTRPQ